MTDERWAEILDRPFFLQREASDLLDYARKLREEIIFLRALIDDLRIDRGTLYTLIYYSYRDPSTDLQSIFHSRTEANRAFEECKRTVLASHEEYRLVEWVRPNECKSVRILAMQGEMCVACYQIYRSSSRCMICNGTGLANTPPEQLT